MSIFKKKSYEDISPEEIFLDSVNLPKFDRSQFEGRMETPIKSRTIFFVGIVFTLVILIFFSRAFVLQVVRGESYSILSENNRLRHSVVFAERGNVLDRNGNLLVWNVLSGETEFPLRSYTTEPGFSHLLGYLSYPAKDTSGFYYSTVYEGVVGVEKSYQNLLAGLNGTKIIETNAVNDIISESQIHAPVTGKNLQLSIDSRVQAKMFEYIKELADRVNFNGGAGAIMSIDTGEVLAITSYPEFDSNMFSATSTSQDVNKLLLSPSKPFLNRAVSGVFTPGSIVKLFVALGALDSRTVDPSKHFVSTGQLIVPNPYNPSQPSVFTDWKAHGSVDMRRAIAVSSNVYFYIIGGGHGDQKGLGINAMEKVFRSFGFGEKTGISLGGELEGVVPSPSWKSENFNGDDWRLGDTYNTAIGQYGMQLTPIQVLTAVSAIANRGLLIKPSLVPTGGVSTDIRRVVDISQESFDIVHEGMRMAVLEGTAQGLNTSAVSIAAKTGTAELGVSKSRVNSWVIGFFPYENPKYVFTILMESGPRENLYGGVSVMRQLVDWMAIYTPEYFR